MRVSAKLASAGLLLLLLAPRESAAQQPDLAAALGLDSLLNVPISASGTYQQTADGDSEADRHPAADALLERFLGDRSLLREVAETFIDHLPVLLGDVDAAVAARDLPSVHRAAHTLKGSAGNFGYAPAFEAALQLEQLGRAGVSDGVAEAADTVHRTMGALVRLLGETIAEPVGGE